MNRPIDLWCVMLERVMIEITRLQVDNIGDFIVLTKRPQNVSFPGIDLKLSEGDQTSSLF